MATELGLKVGPHDKGTGTRRSLETLLRGWGPPIMEQAGSELSLLLPQPRCPSVWAPPWDTGDGSLSHPAVELSVTGHAARPPLF